MNQPETEPITVEVVGTVAPRQVVVIRGAHFGDDDAELAEVVFDHWIAALADDFPDGTPAAKVAPFVFRLPDNACSIELLDEDEMRAAGWVRAEQEGDES